LGRSAHNDHGVKAVAAIDHIPAAARVDGVVVGCAYQNLFGLVVQFAKDGVRIFHRLES
jgi:hypothetical protein